MRNVLSYGDYNMKLTLADPKYLKDSISIIADIVTSAKLSIKNDYIELIAMDSANVAMVIFKMFSSTFIEYDLEKEQDISIDLSQLKQILRRVRSNDILTLSLDNNRLKVIMKGPTTKTFYIPLLEFEEKEQKVPQLKFPMKIITQAAILSEAIEDASIISEALAFVGDKDKLVIDADGDTSKARIEIPGDDNTKIEYSGNDFIKARYSIEYLKKMIQASKLSDTVEVEFDKDYPLHLEFKEMDKLQLGFILAPRVDND
jgi:proliferating cell nuclear antigen